MSGGSVVDDAFLADLDDIRGIPGEIGVNPVAVMSRVITWSGSRVGLGTPTVVDTPLTVGLGSQAPNVSIISSNDALASGGLYSTEDVKVGPMTPPFLPTALQQGGGISDAMVDPLQAAQPKELYFRLSGAPSYQTPVWFKRIGDISSSALRYFLILRRAGVQNPGGIP